MGKSELAAAVALLLTCGDGEERAEVYGCAADRGQASIVFEVAADMIRMCPALSKRCKILTASKRIVYLPTNSFYQVLSAEAYSKHGFNIHGVVFDELHTQPNRKLFDVMTKGSGDARMQPLYFLITTAGTDTKSICYETHQKAKDIIEGRKIDSTFYPVIYGADESDDWTDPKVWKKANPSLGITVGMDKVRAAFESARQNPAEENTFRQLRLNQWVKQAVRWMPMEKWEACKADFTPESLEGRVCYGGLDLSSSTDITAFVLVFPPMETDEYYYILPFFWIPEENLERRVAKDHVPYDIWERQGFIHTTEGNVIHYTCFIAAKSKAELAEKLTTIKNWLYTEPDRYHDLSDTYDTLHTRKAVFNNKLDISEQMLTIGTFTVNFSAKPFRYLNTGLALQTHTQNFSLINPYAFTAKPYIKVNGRGSGTLVIQSAGSNKVWQFETLNGYTECDSELMNFYHDTVLKNDTVIGEGFPELPAGTVTILFEGGITSVEIVPRWVTL